MRLVLRFTSIFLLAASAVALMYLTGPGAVAAPGSPESAPPTLSPAITPTAAGWLILPEFPANATQADVGAEIYRLVCQDCHGDQQQGLTAEWIAAWPEEQQNCWTSKCHAANHPPEGFDLPRAIPAIGGPGALRRFTTALDLHEYISNKMPWHNPGSLTDEQYWQLTAYLLREQDVASLTLPLDEESARSLQLHPETVVQVNRPAAQATQAGAGFWWVALPAGAAVAVLASVLLWRRR